MFLFSLSLSPPLVSLDVIKASSCSPRFFFILNPCQLFANSASSRRGPSVESVVFKIEISRTQRRENYSAVCLPFTVSIGARITSEFPVPGPNVRDVRRTRTNSTKTSIDPSARGKFLSFRALFPYGQLLGIKFALRDERGQPIWEGNDISFFFRLISRRKESEKCGTNLLKVEEISGGSIEFPLKIFRI